MYPTIVSFYTQDWLYPQHAKRLRRECLNLELDCRIKEKPSQNGYIQNCCIKPFFIRECLQELKKPVLWIDVDGSIIAKPDFFLDTDWDFQARRMRPPRTRLYHVGTMWFNYNDQVLEFVDEWCRRTGDMTDESSLDQTFKFKQWELRHRDIPEEYFKILRRENEVKDGVIFHRLSNSESKRQQTEAFNEYERKFG